MSTIWTPERRAAAMASAKKWAGTPHFNRLAVPGTGIDCVHLVSEILHDAGICERWPMPFYDERLGMLRRFNVLETIITTYLNAEALPPEAPEFGDMVICRCGRQTNHIGIILDDNKMWHVPGQSRVGPAGWASWQPRTQSLCRLTGIGYREDPAGLTWETIAAKLA